MGKVLNFGAKNLHYAVKTGDSTYETPVHLAGLIKIVMKALYSTKPFYGDDGVHREVGVFEGYDLEIELYDIAPADLIKMFKYVLSENKLLVETNNPTITPIALLAENIRDDEETQKPARFAFYNVFLEKPDMDFETVKGNELNPVVFKIKGKARPTNIHGFSHNTVRAIVTEETEKEMFDNWYKKVQIPTAIGG